MLISSLAFYMISSSALLFGPPNQPSLPLGKANTPNQHQSIASEMSAVSAYAALLCKKGTKAGKTPISLKAKAKVACYNVKLAAAAKRLLTLDMTKSCFACHASGSAHPVTTMNANLRLQGYTLKPASILSAFNAHGAQMMGASLTSAEAKSISNYLQSIK